MAYTPINWQNGDVITAEKLNRCDNGWDVGLTQLFSESVTTVDEGYGPEGMLAYNQTISVPTLIVNFNGTTYTCAYDSENGAYGAPSTDDGYDFSEYPFRLSSYSGENYIATETAGTFTISGSAESVTTSADFDNAVKKSLESVGDVFVVRFTYNVNDEEWNCDRTPAQIESAKDAGKFLVAYYGEKQCDNIIYDSGDTFAYYLSFDISHNTLQYNRLYMAYGGTISQTTVSYTLTPSN